MNLITTLNTWNPHTETLDNRSKLEIVNSKRWQRGSLDRVVSSISSLIRSNKINIFSGVNVEKAIALGRAIYKTKNLSALDKKVLVQILKHLYEPQLTISRLEQILDTGVSFGTIERFFEASRQDDKLLDDPRPVLRLMDRISDDAFKALLDQASQFAAPFRLGAALLLLADTPPEKRAKLIKIQKEFMLGYIGGCTPKLCLKWTSEEWLRIQNSWISYLAYNNLQSRELATACLLKDPTIFPTACQLHSLFPGLRLEVILAVDGVKPDQREAIAVLSQILCKEADRVQRRWFLTSLEHQYPLLQDILNRIQALPRNNRAKHIQKICSLGDMSEKHLHGLLAIPVDRFDAVLKKAKPWMDGESESYQKIDILVCFGSMHAMTPQEQEEVVTQSLSLTKKPHSFCFSKCLQLVAETPRESRNRLIGTFTKLVNRSIYLRPFLEGLSTKEWLKIEDSWITYLETVDIRGMVEVLKLFLEKNTVYLFAEKLKPVFGAKIEVVKLLHRCPSDAERSALVEGVILLSGGETFYSNNKFLKMLQLTDIPLKELPTHIRTLKEEVDDPDILLHILCGFNKSEPNYFKQALAMIKGLSDEDADRLSRRFADYQHSIFSGMFSLCLSLIHEDTPMDERREILHQLSKCTEPERGSAVKVVQKFKIKCEIGTAIRTILKHPSQCTIAIPLLNQVEATDGVKVAILAILSKQYKEEEYPKAIPLLLSLLSEDEALEKITDNLAVDLETLRSYSQLLKNTPATIKMTLLLLIMNRHNYKNLIPLLLSLTLGVTEPDEIAIIKDLFHSKKIEPLVQLILQTTSSKEFRLYLIKAFHNDDIETYQKIIPFISTTLKDSEHLYEPVINSINSFVRFDRVEICNRLNPFLANAPIESKLELFKALKDLDYDQVLSILNRVDTLSNLTQQLNDLRLLTELGLSGSEADELLIKLNPTLQGKSEEDRLLLLKRQGCYHIVLNHLPQEVALFGAPQLERWFLNTTQNIEAFGQSLLSVSINLPEKYWKEIFSLKFPRGEDGAKKAVYIERMQHCFTLLNRTSITEKQDRQVRQWFNTTTRNFETLSGALLYAINALSDEQRDAFFNLKLQGKPDGEEKALAIRQQVTYLKLGATLPINLVASLVFSTTCNFESLLQIESSKLLEQGLPLIVGLTDGKAKLKVLNAIGRLSPEERPKVLRYAEAHLHDQGNRNTLIQQGVYYHRIVAGSPLPEKVRLNLSQLLATTQMDFETIQNLVHATSVKQRPVFIEVLLAEALALQSRDYKKRGELIDRFFDRLDTYLPFIMERPPLVQYLIRHHYYEMQEAIAQKEYPLSIQGMLIPFLKPSQIVEVVEKLPGEEILNKPVLSGERSWPKAASAFEELQGSTDMNLILSELGEEGFIQSIPFATLSLLAKNKPHLLLPYINYLGDLQLAATLPFLDPQSVAETSMPLPKIIVITKRAPVSLKKLLVEKIVPIQNHIQLKQVGDFYKACGSGDPYPIPPAIQKKFEQAKEVLAESEGACHLSLDFDIPPCYLDSVTFGVMSDPINLPQTGKYIDRTTFDQLKTEGDTIKNPVDNLFYPKEAYKPNPRLKEELKCIDKSTGQVMSKPLKVPPDYTLHIDASLLDLLEKDGKNQVKSPFNFNFYPLNSYLPDPDLEAWLNEPAKEID